MVEYFKVLSDITRLRIVALLIQKEMCVCEIECSLDLTQSNASRHLSALTRSGILTKRKQAQWTYFKISEEFQTQHKILLEYLMQELPKMSTYQDDLNAYEGCRASMPCRNEKNEL